MHSVLLALLLAAQTPQTDLDAVIKRATAYVATYEAALGNLIATEDYLQTWTNDRRKMQQRTSADVLILQIGSEWASLRKVNRVNNTKVKDQPKAFEESFDDTPAANSKRLIDLKTESAQFNLGDVHREINLPTYALKILRESDVWRFAFEKTGSDKIGGIQAWAIHFRETGIHTLVAGDNGERLFSTGTLWIEPATGRVLKTEFDVENPYATTPVKAKTTVTYAQNKLLGMLLPASMSERYETRTSVIDCLADYSNFRRFGVSVKFDFSAGKP